MNCRLRKAIFLLFIVWMGSFAFSNSLNISPPSNVSTVRIVNKSSETIKIVNANFNEWYINSGYQKDIPRNPFTIGASGQIYVSTSKSGSLYTVIVTGGKTSSASNRSGNSSNESNGSSRHIVSCVPCHGSGRCPGCNGKGYVYYNTRKGHGRETCKKCRGSGRCPYCNGSGKESK